MGLDHIQGGADCIWAIPPEEKPKEKRNTPHRRIDRSRGIRTQHGEGGPARLTETPNLWPGDQAS